MAPVAGAAAKRAALYAARNHGGKLVAAAVVMIAGVVCAMLLLLMAMGGVMAAIFGAQNPYECEVSGGPDGGGPYRYASQDPSAAAVSGIPPEYLELYRQAGRDYGLDWAILAGIGYVESGHGTNMGPSSAGALGPMQFMPATWETSGMDGNGDGTEDIMDPEDAIPAGAALLKDFGAPGDYRLALCRYNAGYTGACASYPEDVMAKAEEYRASGGEPEGELAEEPAGEPGGEGTDEQASAGSPFRAALGFLGSSVASREALAQEGGDPRWAYNGIYFPTPKEYLDDFEHDWGEARPDKPNQHPHTGTDVMAPGGTPVYSMVAGTVTDVYYRDYGGHIVMVEVTEDHNEHLRAGDVLQYVHLQERPNLEIGQSVAAGEQIALVGNSGTSSGSYHLHLGLHPADESRVMAEGETDPYYLLADIRDNGRAVDGSGGGGGGDGEEGGGETSAVFPLPEDSGYEYTDDWGDERPTYAGDHEGTDLYVDDGTPISSITAGTVVTNEWQEYGGWVVMVEAAEDVGPVVAGDHLYYAHLQEQSPVAVGTEVQAGQEIGLVGSTGEGPEGSILPDGRGRHLHLGWYDPAGTRAESATGAMNPYPLLQWLEENGGEATGTSAGPVAAAACPVPAAGGAPGSDPDKTVRGTGTGKQVVEEARKYLGTPYVLGGKGVEGGCIPYEAMDCNCLTQTVFAEFGYDLPESIDPGHTEYGEPVPEGEIIAGDMLVWGGGPPYYGHVAIAVGDGDPMTGGGSLIHANVTTGDTSITPGWPNMANYLGARRLVGLDEEVEETGGGGSGSAPSGSGVDVLKEAARQADGHLQNDIGVSAIDESWAEHQGLWEILLRESESTPEQLNCAAMNPLPSGGDPEGGSTQGDGSHVYGAWQMEAQNFDNPNYHYPGGYDAAIQEDDCLKQSVTGMLYVYYRHGNPEAAWSHYQANGYY